MSEPTKTAASKAFSTSGKSWTMARAPARRLRVCRKECCYAVASQSCVGDGGVQNFPGASSSNATFQICTSISAGTEWTTCAVVMGLLERRSRCTRRTRLPCGKGRRALIRQPWSFTCTVYNCPWNVKGGSRLITKRRTDNGIRRLRRRSASTE